MKEVIPHRIVTDEKEIVYEKTTASKFNHFVVNIEPKLASKILVYITMKTLGEEFT